MFSALRLRLGLLASAALLALIPASPLLAQPSDPGLNVRTTPRSPLLALNAALAAAVLNTSIPANLTPPLAAFTVNDPKKTVFGGTIFVNHCQTNETPALVSTPVACYLGNPRGTRNIVLIGDSNTGNWAEALNAGLTTSNYRLVVYTYSGCPSPFLTYSYSGWRTCTKWHNAVAPLIAALHPAALIVATGPWKIPADVSAAQWSAGYGQLFRATGTSGPQTKRILIGTSPSLPDSAPICLSRHHNPQMCGLTITQNSDYSLLLARDTANATAANAVLLASAPWLCSGAVCPVIVDSRMVYADNNHVTFVYSHYLAEVITAAVLHVLLPAN